MSVNTLESSDAQPIAQKQNSELIYRLEDRPPLPQTLFAACQHLLAMFVAVITPALLICRGARVTGAGYATHHQYVSVRFRRGLHHSN